MIIEEAFPASDAIADRDVEIARLTGRLRQAEEDRDAYKAEMIRGWVALFHERRCTCGGDPGQPADHHDISCPQAIK